MVWEALLPGLVDGAFGIFGGLLGGANRGQVSRKNLAAQYEVGNKYQRLMHEYMSGEGLMQTVRGAERAGINPLTILRGGAGGSGGVAHAPVLASSSFLQNVGASVAGAGSALASSLAAAYDTPHERAKQTVEEQGAQNRLDRIQRVPYEKTYNMEVPTFTADNTVQQTTPPFGKIPPPGRIVQYEDDKVRYAGQPVTPELQPPTMTNPSSASKINPNFNDCAMIEERYGESEIGSMLCGVVNFAADQGYDALTRMQSPGGWAPFETWFPERMTQSKWWPRLHLNSDRYGKTVNEF